MLRKLMASVMFAALVGPAFAQQSGTSGSSGTSGQTTAGASGSETTSAGDPRQDAMQKAEQVGIQDARAVEGAFVLQGTSPTATPILLIVGPSGELLAIAAPLVAPSATQSGSASGQSGTSTTPQAGEPAQSGYMATQTNPASPDMWDPVAVESAMRSLEN